MNALGKSGSTQKARIAYFLVVNYYAFHVLSNLLYASVTLWMHPNNELIVKCSGELIVIKIIQPFRDSFIDEKLKPKHRVVKASVLDFLWSYEDENSQVIYILIFDNFADICLFAAFPYIRIPQTAAKT